MDNRDFGGGENSKGQQVEKCIEMADYNIENNSTIEEFKRRVEELLKKIVNKDQSLAFHI